MRSIVFLALATTLACDGGGGDDTGGDDTADDSGTDTSDTGADTSDTASSDTGDTADTEIPPDADFLANGPGNGRHWAVAEPVYSPNDCGVGSQNSLDFVGDEETVTIHSVSTTLGEFALAAQATNVPGTSVCSWESDGTFTCSAPVTVLNLNNLPPPYNMDAVVTSTLEASGRFRARDGVDPMNDEAHTFGTRWAADIDFAYKRSCAGAHCSSAAASSGAGAFPCTSEFSLYTVNYSDPSLSVPAPL